MAVPGLEPLLAALREAGLAAGVREVLRLQHVFAQGPELPSRERLHSVLRAVLVKSAEERVRFDRVFDAWFEGAEEGWRVEEPGGLMPGEGWRPIGAGPRPRRRRRRIGWTWAVAWAILLGTGLALHERPPKVAQHPKPVPETPLPASSSPAPPAPQPAATTTRALTADDVRKRTFDAWVPTFEVTPAPLWQPRWEPLVLLLAALLGTAGLWVWQRRKRWLPAPVPLPPRKGPPRLFLPPPVLSGPQILGEPEQEAMVWGIDHFTSEEPTRRLDLGATVRATVRAGGVPHLIYRQARHAREVWLWIDTTADDPTLQRVADEVAAALKAHGLPVERAAFRGVPQRLQTPEGAVVAPSELDERRDTARVAVLTDGRQLVRRAAGDRQRVGIEALLRQLSHWPQLAFVDFSAGEGELAPLLARHGLRRIAPTELAAFLGRSLARPVPARQGADSEELAWAAACALAPSPVAEEAALALRRRLFPRASPWALATLRAQAPGPPGRLWWKQEERARLVNWLSGAELAAGGSIVPGGRLDRTLQFWEKLYDRELPEGENAELPESPAGRRWLAERLLLQLWRGPGPAVRRLYALFQGGLESAIREAMGCLTSADASDDGRIRLPWSWARPATEQSMLVAMGFGGGSLAAPSLRRPGRVGLALGVGLGLVAGAIFAVAMSGFRGDAEPVVLKDSSWPAEATVLIAPGAIFFDWTIDVAARGIQQEIGVFSGDRVKVRWHLARRECSSTRFNDFERWECSDSRPPHNRLMVVMPGPETDKIATDDLAFALLDSGADDVLISKSAKLDLTLGLPLGAAKRVLFLSSSSPSPESINRLLARAQAAAVFGLIGNQVLHFVPHDPVEAIAVAGVADPSGLARKLHFTGRRKLPEVWPELKAAVGDPNQIELRGLGAAGCRPGETLEENDFSFVRICGGTFTMGSADDDPLAYDAEKPAHQVTVSDFWMARTETTEAQFAGNRPGVAPRPATVVSWEQAQEFCGSRGYRLPTEAEWEYAARAGTNGPWSFEGGEGALGPYAWFGADFSGNAHPVGQKLPNPWGLYDMHGNVLEWVADWHQDRYPAAPQVDPTGPRSGEYRVLRGGSFGNSPRGLRSAYRIWSQPGFRGRNFGFRCVRSPRRQP